jgi:hypothetical protein
MKGHTRASDQRVMPPVCHPPSAVSEIQFRVDRGLLLRRDLSVRGRAQRIKRSQYYRASAVIPNFHYLFSQSDT